MQIRKSIRVWRARDVALLTLLLCAAAGVHWQAIADIIAIGRRDEEQSHIFLAPLVAAWLLWLRRSRLRFVRVQPSWIGPLVALGGVLLSAWGFEAGVQIAWHGGALVTLVGALISMTGLTPLRVLAPVFFVLLFLLPAPGGVRHQIALPLQHMATTVTHGVLEIIGVSAVKSGAVLVINGEQVAVGEACNGMRMVFALALIVYAFAFGAPLRPGVRIGLLVLSPVIALICNAIRLAPTSLLYGYADPELAETFHDLAGWVMLPVALFALAGLLRGLKWLEFPVVSFRLAGATA